MDYGFCIFCMYLIKMNCNLTYYSNFEIDFDQLQRFSLKNVGVLTKILIYDRINRFRSDNHRHNSNYFIGTRFVRDVVMRNT